VEGELDRTLRDVDLVHNASQYVHCLAQGKIGSGFDVSSAVYGSQIYKRFDDSVLRPIMSEGKIPSPEEASRSLRVSLAAILTNWFVISALREHLQLFRLDP